MAEPVVVEFGEEKTLTLAGGLEGEFPAPAPGEDVLIGFSDGTLLRCASTTVGGHIVAVNVGDGTVQTYEDEEAVGAELNGVRYQWALCRDRIVRALAGIAVTTTGAAAATFLVGARHSLANALAGWGGVLPSAHHVVHIFA